MARHRTRRAFTATELLVCMGILAVLVGVTMPIYTRVTQGARAAACVSNLRQLGAGLGLYLGEHNMMMPTLLAGRRALSEPGPVIDDTLSTYVGNAKVFACPADSGGLAARTGTSYYWNVVINGQPLAGLNMLGFIKDISRIPILSDKGSFHPYEPNKVNLLYADGHAEREFTFKVDHAD